MSIFSLPIEKISESNYSGIIFNPVYMDDDSSNCGETVWKLARGTYENNEVDNESKLITKKKKTSSNLNDSEKKKKDQQKRY